MCLVFCPQRALLRLQALPTSGGYRRPRTCERLLRPKQYTVLAPRPRNESSSVRSFAVISDQAWWFLRAWDVAFTRALQMMSFTAKWRAALPVDRLQTSPWWPPESAVSL